MNQLKIYFYESERDVPANIPYVSGWTETNAAIEALEEFIATTQMGLLGTDLIQAGYEIHVHPAEGKPYEISLGPDNTCTDKELRPAHNLFRMWQAGAFHADAVAAVGKEDAP